MTTRESNSIGFAPDLPRERIAWIDLAKGGAIGLVVVGHVLAGLMDARILDANGVAKTVYEAIYLFHMQLFFFLSGLNLPSSLERNWPWRFAELRWRGFLFPCIVWGTFQTAVAAALSGSTNHPVGWSELLHFFDRPPKQFWFTMAFGLQLVVLWGLYGWLRKKTFHLLLLYGVILWFVPIRTGVVAIDTGLVFWGFLALGMLMAEHARTQLAIRIRWGVLLFVAYGIGLYLLAGSAALNWTPARLMAALLGIVVFVVVSVSLAKFAETSLLGGWAARGLDAAGKASLPIFLVHILVASGSRMVLSRIPWLGAIPWLHLVGASCLGMVFPIVLWRATRRGWWAVMWGLPTRS